jgi:hypothetical protein
MSSRIDVRRNNESEAIARSEFDALLAARYAPAGPLLADELLEWIEDSDCVARFIPELPDAYENAA